MAEGAHLTSAFIGDTPSVFEVLAQESLVITIRPAVKHAVRVLAERRPDRYGWLLRCYDEVYTSLDLLLQSHYLRNYAASFAENFYGLRRVTESGSSPSKLGREAFWKSLLCLVFLPYIKQKLDEIFEDLRHVYNTSTGHKGMSSLTRAFVAIYPYMHSAWEAAILGYQSAYMFGRSNWHSPFLHMAGVTLNHDLEDHSLSEGSMSFPWQQSSRSERLLYVVKKVFNMAAVTISTSLSVGVFFIQFLDWWYANDVHATSLTSLPVPDPPKIDEREDRRPYNICPICHRTRSNDTVLSVSGYVFCYPCIYDYVQEYHKCPMTNYPARTNHLIKLYIVDS